MTTPQDRLDEMKAASTAKAAEEQKRAPAWKPSEGDVLAGRITRIDHVMTSNGDSRLMVVKDVEDNEEKTVWCSGKMLLDLVLELAPPVGSLIVVEYHGKFPVQSNPSYSFNKYTMIVDEDPDFAAWDQVSAAYHRKANASANSAEIQTFDGPDEAPF